MQPTKPKVLMLATTVPGTPGDGTPAFVLDLAAHVRPASVTIVAPRAAGSALDSTYRGVRLRRFRYAPRRFERLADQAILPALRAKPALWYQAVLLVVAMLFATNRAAKEEQTDVLHAHWILPTGLIAWAVGQIRSIPYVVTAHGADAYALNGRIAGRLKRLVLSNAEAVYPVSHEIAEKLNAIAPGCVTKVLPMGVDQRALAAAAGPRQPQPGSLLFVGRLAEKKGLPVLLDALALLNDDLKLTVVGDGPDRAKCEQQARDLGLNNVSFVGRQSANEVAKRYAKAAAVVIPSCTASDGDRDGTPVVLMEALSLGVPVVATDLGGIRELLAPFGVPLAPEGDSAALAALLMQVTKDARSAEARADALQEATASSIDVGLLGRGLASDFSRLSSLRIHSPVASAA